MLSCFQVMPPIRMVTLPRSAAVKARSTGVMKLLLDLNQSGGGAQSGAFLFDSALISDPPASHPRG